MNPLINKQCRDYSERENALDLSAVEQYRSLVPDWQYCATENHLIRVFHFDDYDQTMQMLQAIAEIAKKQNHHPEMVVTYNRLKVSFDTHTVNGLTENDFICAAQIDQLPQLKVA